MAQYYTPNEQEKDGLKNDLKLESQLTDSEGILSFTAAPNITSTNFFTKNNISPLLDCHLMEMNELINDLGVAQTFGESLAQKRRRFN